MRKLEAKITSLKIRGKKGNKRKSILSLVEQIRKSRHIYMRISLRKKIIRMMTKRSWFGELRKGD